MGKVVRCFHGKRKKTAQQVVNLQLKARVDRWKKAKLSSRICCSILHSRLAGTDKLLVFTSLSYF